MDLKRKTLGQLMAGVLGIGNSSKAVKVDAAEQDSDDEQDAADDADESDDAAETDDEADDETEQEEAPKKKATAPAKTKSGAAGTVTLKLADYNALQAEADQAKTLRAAATELKKKADAWDAHQKAIGGVAPKADTTNDAPDTEENAEAKEMNRLSERYKGMIPE